MPEDELKAAAMKIVFVNAKKTFEEQSIKGMAALKEEALAALAEQAPNDATINAVRGTPLGTQYVKIFEDAKQKIETA